MDSSLLIGAAAVGVLGAVFWSAESGSPTPGTKLAATQTDAALTAADIYSQVDTKIHPHLYHKMAHTNESGRTVDLFQREQMLNAVAPNSGGMQAMGQFMDALRGIVAEKERITGAVHRQALRHRDQTKSVDQEDRAKVLAGALADFTHDPKVYKPISRFAGHVREPR